MEYTFKIDGLMLTVEMQKKTCLQFNIISDHDTPIHVWSNDDYAKHQIYKGSPWQVAMFDESAIPHLHGMENMTGLIYISRDEIIMRLPDGDYGLEFTSALPVDLKIGDNHITGLQGTIPVKAAAFPFDQRGQTVGTQVNTVSVHGTGNVIGSMNIVNGDFVKGNKYSKR